MIPSVSSSLEAAPVTVKSVPAAPVVQAASAPAPVAVEISMSAQVKQLDASGSTLEEISLKTGLDTPTIKLFLGQ